MIVFSLCGCQRYSQEGIEISRLCPDCEVELSQTLLNATQFVLDWAKAVPLSVSTAGGTGNVLAGELSRFCGISYKSAHKLLVFVDGPYWYEDLYWYHTVGSNNNLADPRGVAVALKRATTVS